jgi:hypothetical protein
MMSVIVIVMVMSMSRVGMRFVVMVNVWVMVIDACVSDVISYGMVMTGVRVKSALPLLTRTTTCPLSPPPPYTPSHAPHMYLFHTHTHSHPHPHPTLAIIITITLTISPSS